MAIVPYLVAIVYLSIFVSYSDLQYSLDGKEDGLYFFFLC